MPLGVKSWRIYTYDVGIWRCSFSFDGQCQSLYVWSNDTLRNWLRQAGFEAGQIDKQNNNASRTKELEAEIRALRKQLAAKDEVIDILKKSVGILSKP